MRRYVVFLALAINCGPATVDLELQVDPGVRSLLLIVDDGESLRAFAEDVQENAAIRIPLLDRYVGAYPLELTALMYGSGLDAYGIPRGAIVPSADGFEVPIPRVRRRAIVRGAAVEPWRSIPVEELGERVASLRLPARLTDVDCLQSGRCFDLDVSPDACLACPDAPAPALPAEPAAPDLSGCSWIVREEAGTRVCAPWAEAPPACAGLEVALPGSAECVRIGGTCPAGQFSERLPEGPVVYVRPGESIAAAVALAEPGTVVALAKGTFDEVVSLADGVSLIGACAAETAIRGAVMGVGSSRIADLSIDATGTGIRGTGGATGRATGVVVSAGGSAVRVEGGARLELADSLVRSESIVAAGRLELLRSATEARIETSDELRIEDAHLGGNVKAIGTADVEVRRTAVRGRAIRIEGGTALFEQVMVDSSTGAPGLTVRLGSQVVVRKGWFRNNVESNVLVRGIGTRFSMEDSVLSDARGAGLRVLASGNASLARTVVERTTGAGVFVEEEGSTASLADVVIRDVTARPSDLLSSNGIHLEANTVLTVDRLRVERVAGKALDIDGARAEVRDLLVEETGSGDCHQCSGLCGFAVARLEGERVLVRGTAGRSIHCRGTGCEVVLSDVLVERAGASGGCRFENPNSTPRFGQAVVAAESGSVRMSRFLITASEGPAIALEEFDVESFGTALWFSDGAVDGNATGVHLQVPQYPLPRVANRVVYRNNRVNVVR